MHRRPVYIYFLNVPSFSSRYFNKIKRTSRLGRLLALSLEILCNCPMFCFGLLCVHTSFARKRELVALLCVSSWCLVIVVRHLLKMPQVCLQFVIGVFPDHTHALIVLYCIIYAMASLFARNCILSGLNPDF